MPAATSYITRRPHPDGAEACVRDTNVSVWGLVQWRKLGLPDEEILERVAGLTREDLLAAWDYYARHPEEIDQAIRRNDEA